MGKRKKLMMMAMHLRHLAFCSTHQSIPRASRRGSIESPHLQCIDPPSGPCSNDRNTHSNCSCYSKCIHLNWSSRYSNCMKTGRYDMRRRKRRRRSTGWYGRPVLSLSFSIRPSIERRTPMGVAICSSRTSLKYSTTLYTFWEGHRCDVRRAKPERGEAPQAPLNARGALA